MPNQEIRQITTKELLILNYNDHLKKWVFNLIELEYVNRRDPNEIVLTVFQQGFQGTPPIERKIKAKEAQMRAKELLDKESSILKVIQDLIKKEETKPTQF